MVQKRRTMNDIWLAIDLPLTDYAKAQDLQIQCVAAKREGRLQNDLMFLLEHPPVFTLGRNGGRENLMVTDAFLDGAGVRVMPSERGGNITYHGPGQVVGYPVIDLHRARLGVEEYVSLLESLMMDVASHWGVPAVRDSRNRGVWVGERKLGSVGIAVRRGISYHGLALNVNPDLTPFQWIHPCGLHGVDMTSLALEAKKEVTAEAVIPGILRHLADVLEAGVEETPPAFLATRMGAGFPEEARVLLG